MSTRTSDAKQWLLSARKVQKSRSVFGDIFTEDDVSQASSNSLSYSPSPSPYPVDHSRDEEFTPVRIQFDCNTQNQLCDDAMKENTDNRSADVRSIDNSSAKKGSKGSRKKTGYAYRRDLGKKAEATIDNAIRSVNETLNAARKAKHDSQRHRTKHTTRAQREWKRTNAEAKSFKDEMERKRHEILALQKQLSSKVYKAKAKHELDRKQARLGAIEKESQFNSEVYREHKQKQRDDHLRERRVSMETRAKLRRNHREGEEKMRMMAIQEDQVLMEERHLSSVAWRETRKANATKRRESFAFRNGDARRIRQLHAEMEEQRKADESASLQLKWDGERDAERYKEQLSDERRKSLTGRNREGRRQRLEEEERVREEQEASHRSYELKWDGERDAAAYQDRLAAERRESLAVRNEEGSRQRLEEKDRKAVELVAEHESYELKWEGERDAVAYKKQLADERRESFAFRNKEASRQRQKEREVQIEEAHARHESYELKWAGDNDAIEYKRQLEAERRDSLASRNRQRAQQQKMMQELKCIAQEKERECLMAKWEGENDAKKYHDQLANERRQSLALRNEEGRRHRELEAEMHEKEVQKSHEDEQLRADCQRDVEQYKRDCAERERQSFRERGKALQLQRLKAEDNRQVQREIDENNRVLEDGARMDVKLYIEDCKKRRRMSLAHRAKEKRQHAAWKKAQKEKELEQKSRDTRDQAMDRMYTEIAQQQERARIAMDAIRHAGGSFPGNPFAAILEE